MVIQWPFMSHIIYLFFLTKLQKNGSKEKSFLCHSFLSNSDFKKLGILKGPSDPQFCESY